MLPIVANVTNFIPVQTPLVNTAIPGSDALRVPSDNVAPSVSSAQVDNNASNNNALAAAASETDAANAQAQGATTSATFVTQLLAEDLSPPATQVILVQYEKLIALSNVKYKPSNALKPESAPAGVFGQILQQEKPVAQVAQAPVQVAAPVPPTTPEPQPVQEANAPVIAAPEPVATLPANDNQPVENTPAPVTNDNTLPTPPAIAAYAQTAARPVTQAASNVTELA